MNLTEDHIMAQDIVISMKLIYLWVSPEPFWCWRWNRELLHAKPPLEYHPSPMIYNLLLLFMHDLKKFLLLF